MKEFLTVLEFLTGNRYSGVNSDNTNAVNNDNEDITASSQRHPSRRNSSVGVNRFFADSVRLEKRRRSRCAVYLMLAGVTAIGLACFIIVGNPYEIVFNMKVRLTDGGETFELWRKPSVGLFLKAYLFNITNKDAFLRGEEKLHVEEVGPYTYREDLEHANVSFNDNGTLTMSPKHPLIWAPELSNGSEDDILVLPNIALLSIANVVKDSSLFTRLGLNLLIKRTDSHPLVEMTAKEFMFGYRSPITTLGNSVMPSWIIFDKIGLVDRMYDFNGDVSTVFTGESDIRYSGLFDTYRGSEFLPHWHKGEECEGVSSVKFASDASKFQTHIQKNDSVRMFRKSLCRVMPMERIGETVVGGLNAYNYTWKEGIMDNGRVNPENKCFCRGDYCMPEGLLDVADCFYGFPIALSYPHFYKADQTVLDSVEGMYPDANKHATKFVIQPETGLTLSTIVRMQINMAFGDLSRISRAERFSHMVLPMMWTEIAMYELPPYLMTRYYIYLNVLPVILDIALYVLIIVGSLCLIFSIIRVLFKSCQEKSVIDDCENKIDMSRKNYNEINQSSIVKEKEMDIIFSSFLLPHSEECEAESMIDSKEGAEDII